MLRANPTIASPSAVSATECVSRCTSVRPTCRSRRLMCWLTVGCCMPSRAAARVKLPGLLDGEEGGQELRVIAGHNVSTITVS